MFDELEQAKVFRRPRGSWHNRRVPYPVVLS